MSLLILLATALGFAVLGYRSVRPEQGADARGSVPLRPAQLAAGFIVGVGLAAVVAVLGIALPVLGLVGYLAGKGAARVVYWLRVLVARVG